MTNDHRSPSVQPRDRRRPARPSPLFGPVVTCAILAALLLGSPSRTAARVPADTVADGWRTALARFQSHLAEDVTWDDAGGITAAVFSGPSVIWSRSFGWADRAVAEQTRRSTVYRVGSITKSVTAVLLALLVQDGVVALEDPVREYLPALSELSGRAEGQSPITFGQLASHTAGLVREPALEDAASGPIGRWEEKILASIPETRFQSAPGEEFSYSNIGFGILGLALARAGDAPYRELVRERILEPLGMESSTFVVDGELEHRLAAGYAVRSSGRLDPEEPAREHRGRGYKVPNGGLYTTVADLARFSAAVMGRVTPELLHGETRRAIVRDRTPKGDTSYGLGFFLRDSPVGKLVGHGGSVAGYNAQLLFHPGTGLGVVLLRNYDDGSTELGDRSRELLRRLVRARRSSSVAIGGTAGSTDGEARP